MDKKTIDKPGFGGRGEFLVLIQFALMIGFALLPVWHPGLGADTMAASATLRTWLAVPFALVALVFGAFGSVHIRDYLTPLPYPVDHNELVQHGVYAIVRHPLYASLLFAGAAWTVYNLSLSHLMALCVAFVFFDYKATKEEGWLMERHPEYADYARRAKRFIPWVY
ncbi:MAG: isoprenylcysteine carboxylmethyltransferase family protein [Thiohalocapsa sp.]|jgi:protein-S-isoprenylcysteine O-methyltransferase Ste14|uniref:methyltransferase family protein n=1 Tax=Thiohalocapsa sp. TaxID=2497641 RepID=UPI0025F45C40|nr:isoprenylcysteine carboxylmethyltransferase family protein [Thiohalocapsa sp.]MCG6943187.1 isoprenylcysteine carboxylmethyltransferase family protein [Thiohalocapsa sp.]